MIGKIRRIINNLRSNTSGNALMLVGIGLPAFVGSAGLAVDAAQWYQWKRELQFAVDQAALAGAYARSNNDTKSYYSSRASREYTANLTTIASFAATPTVSLSDYNHGSSNSVIVTSSASKALPFSGFLIGRAVTVKAMAQASFTDGTLWTSCLMAVDPDDSGAITISGNTLLVARCGLAALSTSSTSVVVNGNPTLDVGWVVSKGGIDPYFDTIENTSVNEYVNDLYDPYASLTPPTNSTAQTYSCKAASTSSETTGTETTTITTQYYSGDSKNSMTLQSSSTGSPSTVNVDRPSLSSDQSGTNTTTSTTTGSAVDHGSTASPRYTRTDYLYTVVSDYTITTTTTPAGATMNPGTYTGGVKISCDTVMNPGIYVMNGGDFETNAQYTVTGSGVMIVLQNGAGLQINGGANVNLTAMTTSQLEAAGVPSTGTTNSSNLAGMLVFEDRTSQGTSKNHNRINGNASTLLNGTIYLPVSSVSFAGTASVSSQCLMIAASTITLEGDLDMTSFCPPNPDGTAGSESTAISSGSTTVRLVA